MRTKTKRLCPALVLGLIVMAPAMTVAMPVQFDVSSTFNADVIVNASPAFDLFNSPVDPDPLLAFGTQSAMVASGEPTPDGLPDNGFFPANANHPDVQLAYRNTDNGLNARQSIQPDTYSFLVPTDNYSDVHLFMTTGSGPTLVEATAIYTSGLPDRFIVIVPDWGFDPAPQYYLIDALDQIRPTAPFTPNNGNDAAIFGFRFDTDETRILASMTILSPEFGQYLSFFGATGVTVDQAGSIPEPATLALLGIGLAGLGFSRRKRELIPRPSIAPARLFRHAAAR